MAGPTRPLLLLCLLAPLGFGCASEAELPMARPAAESPDQPALPMAADSAAEAKLAQQYANALANQLNVEREQRRRDLAELKRRLQTEKRIEEAKRRQQEKELREQEARARKAPKPPRETLMAVQSLPASAAAAPLAAPAVAPMPIPPAIMVEDVPVFEPTGTIAMPQALGSAKRNPAPVLFDPETRKGG